MQITTPAQIYNTASRPWDTVGWVDSTLRRVPRAAVGLVPTGFNRWKQHLDDGGVRWVGLRGG